MVDLSYQQFTNRPQTCDETSSCREIVGWVLLGAVVVSLILVYSFNQSQILGIQYRIEEIRQDNLSLQENNQALRAEYQTLKNPGEIADKGTALGLISANRPEVRIIKVDAHTHVDNNLVAEVRSDLQMNE